MDDPNPYAAPQAEEVPPDYALEGDASIRRRGNKLLVPEDAKLPMRCVSCNRPASIEYRVWAARNPASRLLWGLLAGVCFAVTMGVVGALAPKYMPELIFPFFIVPMIALVYWLQRRNAARLEFYICPWHNTIRYFMQYFWIAWMVLFFAREAIGKWLGNRDFDEYYFTWIFPLLIAFVLLSSFAKVQLYSRRRVKGLFEVQGFGKRYLSSFPDSDDT